MGTCRETSFKEVASVGEYATFGHYKTNVTKDYIQSELRKHPLTMILYASDYVLSNYKSGVIRASDCTSTTPNHQVMAVGFGTLNGVDYYIIKNSWGTSWGDNGFFKIEATNDTVGACGTHKEVIYIPSVQ